MITNIPRGMSQDNRAHPFFIILRRYTEEEEFETKRMTKTMLLHLLCPLIGILPLFLAPWGRFFASAMMIAWLVKSIQQYWQFRAILANTSFPKVNHMLFGNDYSMSPLNYEEVINMIGAVNMNLGRIRVYMDGLLSGTTFYAISIGVFCILNVIRILFDLS